MSDLAPLQHFAGWASVAVPSGAPVKAVAQLALQGVTTAEPIAYYDGRLYVPLVSQAVLDAAAAVVRADPVRETTRVVSVLPVAFLTVLAAMPAPEGSPAGIEDAEDAVSAAVQSMPKPFRIAWARSVRILRADLVTLGPSLGWNEAMIDGVLLQAARLPGAGPVYERVPRAFTPPAP